MTAKVIPKEQLTAYQRWELNSFQEGAADPGETDTGPVDDRPVLILPTAEDLERLHQEAWAEGYRMGMEEGRQAGFQQGRQEGARYVEQLRLLAEALEAERVRSDAEVAGEVLELALAVARQVIHAALRVKPELMLEMVREALMNLPALSGNTRVVVHPDNAAVVRDWLAQEHPHLGWKVLEDPQMEPGGFRFDNPHSELDATLPTRWQEVVSCLGSETEWLDLGPKP